MLPSLLQLPATLVLLVAGIVACFFGYRLFNVVLALFGLMLGASAAASAFAQAGATTQLVAIVVGALAGAGLMIVAYFIGVALVGAALGAAAAHLLFAASGGQPGVLVLVLLSIAGAVGAMYLQRYFLIVGTAFGGAWAILLGAMALLGSPATLPVAGNGLWALYPLDPVLGRGPLTMAWVVLGVVGMVVQLGWTGGLRGRIGRRRK